MEYGWDQEYGDFRARVSAFATQFKTPEVERELEDSEGEGATPEMAKKIRNAIEAQGWMRMCWPASLGGEGKSPWYQYVLVDELQRHGIPYSLGSAAMIGPAIEKFGTDEQKAKYLPGLWSGEITCALGYSEPNAGTDLASLETGAAKDGDDWVINGQKLWTSGAHRSTHVWLAARTDPKAPKHRGISMFIVPLSTPGIAVRPIITMGGTRTNETFYEDVRVPGDALIGEEGRGWYIAANALDHERVTIGGGIALHLSFSRLLEYIKEHRPDLLADRAVRTRLAQLRIDLQCQRALTLTNSSIVAGGGTPTMEASMVKIWSSELRYRMESTWIDILGRSGLISDESEGAVLGGQAENGYRRSPILRFGGGTNEVQRNIIAQRGLGLPR